MGGRTAVVGDDVFAMPGWAEPVPVLRVERPLPLVIDLDGAGLSPAFVAEAAIRALRGGPSGVLSLLSVALPGRGSFDHAFDRSGAVDPGPGLFDARMLAAATRADAEGREVLILTSAFPALARRLCATTAWADDVIVAPRGDDIAELARLAAVRTRCPGGFVAFSGADEGALWVRAAGRQAAEPGLVDAVAPPVRSRLRVWVKAARLHQWTKNLLVFLPLVLAGRAFDASAWLMAAMGFLAFGLVASATYLLNDLHDLDHDRAHRSKRHRPLASGALSIPAALVGIVSGLGLGLGLAAASGPASLAILSVYLAATLAYTFRIKRVALLDAVTLAGLFTSRLVAGVVFCGVAGSAWLFVLSMFLFTSLALAKRYGEIRHLAPSGAIPGRGYVAEDGPVVLAFGTATAAAAVLMVSLYIVEAATRQAFYVNPEFLWLAPVAVFVWLGRIWLLCGRGALNDDPVEFAITDGPSLALGLAVLTGFCLACMRF
ncbi:UbiA family prenyltransferase [Methylobacterium sp. Leaf108]|uniref:UbiA family prenyltransferase n=1 Tax=Methylobacterium sp. Leaf108 TaxID=1736256 RepID=UPI0012E813D8|nr:UbiA family prenyltransferase [Methylobacterium sp. Leaf108]